ncbi:MAG: hypothetical protein FJ272_21230, partial [Planctomycetes bacterium]|nr:hypothetical protein [Planctomycetota bacterium]
MNFIRKYVFWVAIGIACVAAITLQFVLVTPISGKNAQIVTELNKRKGDLDQFAKKKAELHNQHWIDTERSKIQVFAAEREKCEKFLLALSAWYKAAQLKDEADEVITDNFLWKTAYIDECRKLEADVATKVHVGGDALVWHWPAWGAAIPTEPQIAAAWLNYLVQKEMVEIVTFKNASVIFLRSIRVGNPTKGPGWRDQIEKVNLAIPITLVVEMDFEKLPHLIHALVTSKLSFVVRTVNVMKTYTPVGTRVTAKAESGGKAKGKADGATEDSAPALP